MGAMSEVQFWHLVATASLFLLVGVLSVMGKGVLDDMKTKLSKEEFASYLADAKQARTELRDTLIKLFEKMENHDKLDVARFEGVVKDFNGGLQSLRDTLHTSKLEIFDRINGKADR